MRNFRNQSFRGFIFLFALTVLSVFPKILTLAIEVDCESIVWKKEQECEGVSTTRYAEDGFTLIIEIKDWKKPPKKMPWSKIVEVRNPSETYRAIWDQDYQGTSLGLSYNRYSGFLSRWTAESISLSQFKTSCIYGICSKKFLDVPNKVYLSVNGDKFLLEGVSGLFAINKEIRNAILNKAEKRLLRISFGADNPRVYDIGKETTSQISVLLNEKILVD